MADLEMYNHVAALKDKKLHKLLLMGQDTLLWVDRYYPYKEGIYKGVGRVQPLLRVTSYMRLKKFYSLLDKTYRAAFDKLLSENRNDVLSRLYKERMHPWVFSLLILADLAVCFTPFIIVGISGDAFIHPYMYMGNYCVGESREHEFLFKQSAFDRLNMVSNVKDYFKDIAQLG